VKIPSDKISTIPAWQVKGMYFLASDWSKDGKQLAGGLTGEHADLPGVITYSFATQKYSKLTDFGQDPHWLKDSRQIIFFSKGKLYLLDSLTNKWHSILSAPLDSSYEFGMTANDDRTLYFTHRLSGSDIWMLEFQ